MLAAEHRRGLAYRSMGNDTVCRSKIYPTLPKQQYKLNMFYPTPETKTVMRSVSPHTNGKVGLSVIQPVKAVTAPT